MFLGINFHVIVVLNQSAYGRLKDDNHQCGDHYLFIFERGSQWCENNL